MHTIKINRLIIKIAKTIAKIISAGSAAKIGLEKAAPKINPNASVNSALKKPNTRFRQKLVRQHSVCVTAGSSHAGVLHVHFELE